MLRVVEKFEKIRQFSSQIEACKRHYGSNRLPLYIRALQLLLAEFSPKEIILWGMLDPALDKEALSRFVSKERFSSFQASVSPVNHACLLEDKEVFARYCHQLGVPIPETIAFLSSKAVWFLRDETNSPISRLEELLQESQDCELIIKPVDGVYGIGVRALRVDGVTLHVDGRCFSVAQLMGQLEPGRRYILQRRLYNHPVLERATGFKTLQALRVVTALPDAPGSRGRVMSASLRISANEDVVNNFNYGKGGNIRAKIEVESGRVLRAVRASASGFGLEEVRAIDRTSTDLVDLNMPLWREMIEMLEVKSALFYPIRLVGWDVALTPQGPFVIEGNFWFDPAENAFGEVSGFMDRVNSEFTQVK